LVLIGLPTSLTRILSDFVLSATVSLYHAAASG
jgi:hypothetical protein